MSDRQVFSCKKCGECCYGEGGIFLERDEVDRIARFLGLSVEIFLKQFCEAKSGRTQITTDQKGFCVFYRKDQGCAIHPVKPAPCRLWPFYPAIVQEKGNWELAREACPGISRDCTFEEFVKEAVK